MDSKKMKQLIKEVEKRMNKKQDTNKGIWIGIAIAAVAALIGIILWLKSKQDECIEEYYEYFDDELEEAGSDEELYGDSEEVEYVSIKAAAGDEVEEVVQEETVEA